MNTSVYCLKKIINGGVFFILKMSDFEIQMEDFFLYCTSKNLSKKTLKSYEQSLTLFKIYLQEELEINQVNKIEKNHIRQYVQYLKQRGKYTVMINTEDVESKNNPFNRADHNKQISDATINNYLRNIKVFFNWLYDEGQIKKNPVDNISYLKVERKKKKTITEAEFKTLLRTFDLTTFHGYRNWVMTRTLLDTGLRIGECCNLEVGDLDLKNRTILVRNTKGRKDRYVFTSNNLAKDLIKWLKYKDRYLETDFVFPSNRGTAIQVGSFETQLKQAGERIGLDVHPHQLRNNFAKQYLLNGGDFLTLSRILGHSSVHVTEQAYMDLTPKELNRKYQRHSPLSNWDI